MTKFVFSENGRVFLPIYVKPLNDITMRSVDFKVDTGADFTAISKSRLELLGYDAYWLSQNTVATGEATAASGDQIRTGVVRVPIINFLGYKAYNWPFYIMLDESKDFRNLLGRDLLSGFNYTFNNDDDIFQIARAREFKQRFEFLDGQEIHTVHMKG